MFRTTTLATVCALALSGFIATPASAQHLHGDLTNSPNYSHHHHGYGAGHHFDSYHYDHRSDYGHGHIGFPAITQNRHHAIPVHAGAVCPSEYRTDTIASGPIDCPLQRGRALSNSSPDNYQPGFGYEISGHNHSHSGDSHSGHSHGGHSHSENSQQSPFDNDPPTSLGRSDLAPLSLPHGSVNDSPPQQDFRREQPPRDDSIRIDVPPPSSIGPISPAPSNNGNSKRFDTPPPSTL